MIIFPVALSLNRDHPISLQLIPPPHETNYVFRWDCTYEAISLFFTYRKSLILSSRQLVPVSGFNFSYSYWIQKIVSVYLSICSDMSGCFENKTKFLCYIFFQHPEQKRIRRAKQVVNCHGFDMILLSSFPPICFTLKPDLFLIVSVSVAGCCLVEYMGGG